MSAPNQEEMDELRIRTLNEDQKQRLKQLSKEELERRNSIIKEYITNFSDDLSLDIAYRINRDYFFDPPICGYQVRGHKVWRTICLKQGSDVLIEIMQQDLDTYTEGGRREVLINKVERNPIVRERALEIHGKKCQVCGYEAKYKYNDCSDSVGLISHHKELLSQVGEIQINPQEDIAIVCAICHYLIHEDRAHHLSIEEAKQKVRRV